jgi:dienelactone hydrolase
MLVQSTSEHRRVMDYLAMRPEIDVGRIGFLGRSLGGLVTFILTAIDPRVKVAITCSTCPIGDYYVDQVGWDDSAKMRLAPVAPRNFAPAITRAAFLMLNGERDQWGTVEEIQALHRLVRSPTKALELFDCGHRLPSEYIPKAVEWFHQYLGSKR